MNNTETSARPEVGAYAIDTARSEVSFTCRHMFGLGRAHGTFTIRHGSVGVAEPIESSTVAVEIDTASFHTGVQARDDNVRSATYLDVERFPTMTFDSGRVVRRDDGGIALEGQFTVRDVTRPVRLEIADHAVEPGGFTARANIRIDRREFGLTAGRGMTGRHLDVALQISCVRR